MSLDRDAELRHMNEADAHIADAERRITKQGILLDELRRDGHDTQEAERLLHEFRKTLEALYRHRKIIAETIVQIDAGLI